MQVIRWESGAEVGLDGADHDAVQSAADRWCGKAVRRAGAAFVVAIPRLAEGCVGEEPSSFRLGYSRASGDRPLQLRVGPHGVVVGREGEPNRIRFGTRRPPSALELELLVDVGINHLLARQGLPVLHGCGIELGGVSVLGLGDSFSGKTTVAVAAMGAGGRVVSDDAVLAVPGEGDRTSVLPVRSYGWLRGKTREIVPAELHEKMVEGEEDGETRWVLHREDGGDGFVDRSTPEVVWIQSIDRRLKESRIEPVDHGQVFAALIRASSPLYLSRHCPEIRDLLIPVFRSLCAQCRGFRVRLAPRLLETPSEEINRLVDLSR